VARVTNGSVLERMNKGRKVINTMKRRKDEYLDHIIQNKNKYQLDEVLRQEMTRKATRLHHLSFTHDILIIGKKLGFPKQPLNYSEALEEEEVRIASNSNENFEGKRRGWCCHHSIKLI